MAILVVCLDESFGALLSHQLFLSKENAFRSFGHCQKPINAEAGQGPNAAGEVPEVGKWVLTRAKKHQNLYHNKRGQITHITPSGKKISVKRPDSETHVFDVKIVTVVESEPQQPPGPAKRVGDGEAERGPDAAPKKPKVSLASIFSGVGKSF